MTAAPLVIDIVSDVVCPWCYMGKRRIEAAQALAPDIAMDIRWRPFQLAPDLPPEGVSRDAYLMAKFGSVERMREAFARITGLGAEVGIPFAFDRITRSPNTFDAHRLILFARQTGRADAMVEALFRAYFVEGRDLADRATLVLIAEEAGFDAARAAEALEADEGADEVRHELESARALGISGVPFFIFGGRYAVSGAEAPERLAAAARRAVADASVVA